MRTIVTLQDLLELEIKPADLLTEFRALTERSLRDLLVGNARVVVPCPGCGQAESDQAFAKLGLTYRQCARCGSLFVSPRPAQSALDEYYRASLAARFWRERVLPATEAVRREKLIGPRAEWVLAGLAEFAPRSTTGLDLTPYGGPLVDAILQQTPRPVRIIAASATADLDFALARGAFVEARPSFDIESLGPVEFVTAFEILERCSDVGAFAAAAHGVLRPGGLLFLTAPSVGGFDLQVLWDRSPTITPPEKLNVLSIRGFRALFSTDLWEVRELSTPGMFDMEAVRRAVRAEPEAPWPRFVRHLVTEADEATLATFQEFLQRHRLSSFARLLLQKRA